MDAIDTPGIPQFRSVFEGMRPSSYPFRYEGRLHLRNVLGGVPSDPNVIEGWLRTKIGIDKDVDIKNQVLKIMAERDIPEEQAAAEVAKNRSLNGFLRQRCRNCEEVGPLCDVQPHQLMLSGRQLKAGLKEAASVAVSAGKLPPRGWGTTNKGLISFFAEHFFVVEDEMPLFNRKGEPIYDPLQVLQHFVHTRFGSAIQMQEMYKDAQIEFTVMADYYLTDEEWGQIWTTGEFQGLGASRSQGYGRYNVTQWLDTTPPEVLTRAKAAHKRAKDKAEKEEADKAEKAEANKAIAATKRPTAPKKAAKPAPVASLQDLADSIPV